MPDAEVPRGLRVPIDWLWSFLNSAFGIWLLSTIAVGGGAWAFQQWKDAHDRETQVQERIDRLNFEYAGRIAQFGSWFDRQFTKPDPQFGRSFVSGVNEETIVKSIEILEGPPLTQSSDPLLRELYIQPILPEFKDRNFLSIVSELSILNAQEMRRKDIQPAALSKEKHPRAEPGSPIEAVREAAYEDIVLVLLEPRALLDFGPVSYKTFKDNFDDILLIQDIQKWKLPYTDCLDC